jgi:hypothetical protein
VLFRQLSLQGTTLSGYQHLPFRHQPTSNLPPPHLSLQSKSQPFAFFFYFLSIFCSLFFLLFLFHSLPTLSSSNIPNFYFFRIFLRISAQKNSIHYWML